MYTFSVTENMILAVFSGGSERSRVRKFHTWNFRSRERMVLGAKSPVPFNTKVMSYQTDTALLKVPKLEAQL